MNLNNLTTDEFLEKICLLTPHVEKLVNNKELNSILKQKIIANEGATKEDLNNAVFEMGKEKIFKIIPLLLKDNREDIYNIISILNDKTIEEIKGQKVTTTILEIKEMVLDEEIRNFFLSLKA